MLVFPDVSIPRVIRVRGFRPLNFEEFGKIGGVSAASFYGGLLFRDPIERDRRVALFQEWSRPDRMEPAGTGLIRLEVRPARHGRRINV